MKKPILSEVQERLDAIANRPIDGEVEKAGLESRVEILKSDLQTYVDALFLWFRPADSKSVRLCEPQFDLRDLDETVATLAAHYRKDPSPLKWRHYRTVNRACRSVKLRQTVIDVLVRASKAIPDMPMQGFVLCSRGEGTLAGEAKEFMKFFCEVKRGEKEAHKIDLSRFKNVFQAVHERDAGRKKSIEPEPLIRNACGTLELKAYAIFLEWDRADRRWCERFLQTARILKRWVEEGDFTALLGGERELFEKQTRGLFKPSSDGANYKLALARERQSKRRLKLKTVNSLHEPQRDSKGQPDSDPSPESPVSETVANAPICGDAQIAEPLDVLDVFFEKYVQNQALKKLERSNKEKSDFPDFIWCMNLWFRSGAELNWMIPKFNFLMMDSVVRAIASEGRKLSPVSRWDCYVAADRRNKQWKLLETIKSLLKRAEEKIPPRPIMAYLKLAQNKSRLGNLAKKFIEGFRDVRKCIKAPRDLNLKNYNEVYQKVMNRPVLKARVDTAASPEGLTLTGFLELDLSDRIWLRQYGDVVFAIADWLEPDEGSELLEIAPRLFESARLGLDDRPSLRKKVKKAQARNRQTKHRKSKASAESKEPK